MGYKEGTGLGKHAQGRVEIVEASLQRGRRGLGLTLKGLEPSADAEWSEENDKVVSKSWAIRFTKAQKWIILKEFV